MCHREFFWIVRSWVRLRFWRGLVKFRVMKRTDALKSVKQLFRKHKLDKRRWSFAFDRAVERHGECDDRNKKITISGVLTDLNDAAWFRGILLHEIAHAIAGWAAAHGPEWKAVCRQIGADPRPYRDKPPFEPPPKYILTCPGCDKVFYGRRLDKGSYCIACGPEKGLLHVALNPELKEPARSPRVA